MKIKRKYIIIICVLIVIFGMVPLGYLYICLNVTFKMADQETGKPIANTEFHVFRYIHDVDPNSKDPNFFIKTIKTNSEGFFTLNLTFTDSKELTFINSNYFGSISRSKFKSNSISSFSIRVVRFKPDSTFVRGNDVYNLITKRVTFYGPTNTVKTKFFNFIKLEMDKYKPSKYSGRGKK